MDASGEKHNIYCIICDEVLTVDKLCRHQSLNIAGEFKKYVDYINLNIEKKQKEARSIEFYLATNRAIKEGKKCDEFSVMNVFGFKQFILSQDN